MSTYVAKDKAMFEEMHLNTQRQIEKLPEDQQAEVKKTQRVINAAFDEANDMFFGDKVFAIDQFLITHHILGSDREKLLATIKRRPAGTAFTFSTQDGFKAFYKTRDEKIMLASDYIYTLEKAVMYKESYDNLCTFLGFKDIFKLLVNKIKTTFKGEKNG